MTVDIMGPIQLIHLIVRMRGEARWLAYYSHGETAASASILNPADSLGSCACWTDMITVPVEHDHRAYVGHRRKAFAERPVDPKSALR